MYEEPKLHLGSEAVPEPITMETWVDGEEYYYSNISALNGTGFGIFKKSDPGAVEQVKRGLVFTDFCKAATMTTAILKLIEENKHTK